MSRCPECGAAEDHIRDVDGYATCTGCGLVAESHVLDPGPEWRNHADDDGTDRNRCGPSCLLASSGENTTGPAGLAIGTTSSCWATADAATRLTKAQRQVIRSVGGGGKQAVVFGRETEALRAMMQGNANMRRVSVQDDAVRTYRNFRMSSSGEKLNEPMRKGSMAACALYSTYNSDSPSPSANVMQCFGLGPHEINAARNRMMTHPPTEKWIKNAQTRNADQVVSYTGFVVNTMLTSCAEASRTDRAVLRKRAREVEDGVRDEISKGCDPVRVAISACRVACEEVKGRPVMKEWFGEVSIAALFDVAMHTIYKWDALIRRSRRQKKVSVTPEEKNDR